MFLCNLLLLIQIKLYLIICVYIPLILISYTSYVQQSNKDSLVNVLNKKK